MKKNREGGNFQNCKIMTGINNNRDIDNNIVKYKSIGGGTDDE